MMAFDEADFVGGYPEMSGKQLYCPLIGTILRGLFPDGNLELRRGELTE